MNNRFLFPILAFALSAFFSACGVDDIQPEIAIYQPKEDDVFQTGDSLKLSVQFTDNEALSQYKIDVHGNHDGHGHGKGLAILPDWDTLIIGDLEGTSFLLESHFLVPSQILPGPYHITVYALDLNGNESNQTRSIVLVNYSDTVAPMVDLFSPANTSQINTDFSVVGAISDQSSSGSTSTELHKIEITLEPTGGGTESIVALYDTETEMGTVWDESTGDFSANGLDVPSNLASGNYLLRLRVWDKYFNEANAAVEINIP